MSPNGWTDSEIAVEWLKNEFEPLTREKAAGKVRVLVLDGHASHVSLEFIEFCILHDIVVIIYPPHCTHALQGLDVVCFAKMKKEWHLAIDTFEDQTMHAVEKEDFLSVFGSAFLKAFDKKTVLAAFRATGVHPFDPTVIKDEQMKPSEATSTKATFPLQQPSPVRRVMACSGLRHLFPPNPDRLIRSFHAIQACYRGRFIGRFIEQQLPRVENTNNIIPTAELAGP